MQTKCKIILKKLFCILAVDRYAGATGMLRIRVGQGIESAGVVASRASGSDAAGSSVGS